MKKVLLAVILSVLLIACSSEDDDTKDSKVEEETTQAEEVVDKEEGVEEGEVIENEIGEFTILKKNKEVNEDTTSGPIELSITGIQLAELKVAKDMKELFDNKEEVGVITVGMKVENTEDTDVSIYPDQAVLTTNSGDQIDADLLLSDDVGGDFYGKVIKEGEVIFLLDLPVDDIEEVKLIINHAHDDDFESYEDGDLQIPLTF